jgi:predicted amidophosphoribosyltransferase
VAALNAEPAVLFERTSTPESLRFGPWGVESRFMPVQRAWRRAHDRLASFEFFARRLAPLVEVFVPAVCPLCRGARGICGCEVLPEGLVRANESVHARGGGGGALAFGRCGRCAARLPAVVHGRDCRRCRSKPPLFAGVTALGDYRGSTERERRLREWILRFKHGGRRDLARELGLRLAARLRDECRATRTAGPGPRLADCLVTSAPLHPLRKFERGYDQAALLANVVASELERPYVHALARRRATPPQGSPAARAREHNVHGAFRCVRVRQPVEGRDVVLVDDVLASGGTAAAATSTLLREGGARTVWIAVLGRA